PYPMATVGDDFGPYREHLDQLGISTRYVRHLPGEFTPQAFITTDVDDNQITAFHPGAMTFSYLNKISETEGIRIGIVGPDGRQAMMQHSRDFVAEGIPHIFDPGQGMPLFNGAELRQFIEEARWVVVNDYEFQMLQERTGMSGQEIAKSVEALIVTRGGEGSTVITQGEETVVSAVPAVSITDPTGCGDAYRAGLIHGLLNDLDLVTTCRIGSVMGAIKIGCQGPQNHTPGMPEIEQRFFDAYGYRF
ncbi:MAG: carbohydrate kinase family protein, partial [Lysobacterales bacterium]